MKLIDKLKTEHREKLENLEYKHVKESIIEALENEFIFEMTIGGGMALSFYILDKPFDYVDLHDYFNTNK